MYPSTMLCESMALSEGSKEGSFLLGRAWRRVPRVGLRMRAALELQPTSSVTTPRISHTELKEPSNMLLGTGGKHSSRHEVLQKSIGFCTSSSQTQFLHPGSVVLPSHSAILAQANVSLIDGDDRSVSMLDKLILQALLQGRLHLRQDPSMQIRLNYNEKHI